MSSKNDDPNIKFIGRVTDIKTWDDVPKDYSVIEVTITEQNVFRSHRVQYNITHEALMRHKGSFETLFPIGTMQMGAYVEVWTDGSLHPHIPMQKESHPYSYSDAKALKESIGSFGDAMKEKVKTMEAMEKAFVTPSKEATKKPKKKKRRSATTDLSKLPKRLIRRGQDD